MAGNAVEQWSRRDAARSLDFASLNSVEDVFKALASEGVEIHRASEYGDGFELMKDKNNLVDVPFVILDATIQTEGDFGTFVILYVVTKNGDKWVVTDGSTGIRDQVVTLGDNAVGLFCEHGLVRSDYEYTDPKTGEERPATTYYLADVRNG